MATFNYEGTTYTDLEIDWADGDEIHFILYVDLDDPDDEGTEVCLTFDELETAPEALVEAANSWFEGAAIDAYSDRCIRRAESGYAQ